MIFIFFLWISLTFGNNLISKPRGLIPEGTCQTNVIDSTHANLAPLLNNLTQTTFFKFFKVYLAKECPFWPVDGLCFDSQCHVETADPHEIPNKWSDLNAVDYSKGPGFSLLKRCQCDDKDFCQVEEEDSQGVYVNLLKNPERFTGYSGPSAAKVWSSIYENTYHLTHSELGETMAGGREKRVFYRVISGLHASISTHICAEWLDTQTQTWKSNLTCFMERVGNYPERIENIYFAFVVMLRAVSKIGPYLKNYSFCDGTNDWDLAKDLVDKVVDTLSECPPLFDEKKVFSNQEFKLEFRDRFRNISTIMNCVNCEKCRLWGKLQIVGLGTALKVLFSYGDRTSDYNLNRNELVALINGLSRFSQSILSLDKFIIEQSNIKGGKKADYKGYEYDMNIILSSAMGFLVVLMILN